MNDILEPQETTVVTKDTTGDAPSTSDEVCVAASEVTVENEIKDRDFFKKKIHFWWNKTIEGILETGWCLVEAQATLSPDEWAKFVKNDVPFDYSIMRKLMKLAQDSKITDPKYRHLLPASWTSLYEIRLMTPETFHLAIGAGMIGRNQERKTPVEKLRKFRLDRDGLKKGTTRNRRSQSKKSEPQSAQRPTAQSTEEKREPEGVVRKPRIEADPLLQKQEAEAPVSPDLDLSPEAQTEPAKAAEHGSPTAVALPSTPSQVDSIKKNSSKGNITIVLSHEVAARNRDAVGIIKKRIEALVKTFHFIESVLVVETD